MHNKHIDIRHNFLQYIVEDKYIDITYIRSELKPVCIMTKTCSESD